MKTIILILIAITATAAADTFVARVIFSEAGPQCSFTERYYVASAIKNRIGHAGFLKKKTMLEVVKVKNAFECINHKQNQNWAVSGDIENNWDNAHIRKAWREAGGLAKGDFVPIKNIHFFLTKGTKVPKNFIATKYWKPKKEVSTKHFDFYSVTPRK